MIVGEALQRQIELLDFIDSPAGQVLFNEYAKRSPTSWNTFGNTITRSLERGIPFFWASHLLSGVAEAAKVMPDWALTAAAVPVKDGFFWFEGAIDLPPHNAQEPGALTAITWHTAAMIEGSSDEWGKIVSVSDEEWASASKLLSVVFYCRMDGLPAAGIPVTIVPWRIGDSWQDILTKSKRLGSQDIENLSRYEMKLRLFAALLAFLEQRVVVRESHKAPRGILRHQTRWEEAPMIEVVKLRRTYAQPITSGTKAPIDWSCQWMVRGHWRLQWYPVITKHQPIWIQPYVKGPDGKPLKAASKMFAVVR